MIDDQFEKISEDLNTKLASLGDIDRQLGEAKLALKKAVSEASAPHQATIDDLQKTKKTLTANVISIATINRMLLTKGGATKTIFLRSGTIAWRSSKSLVFDVNDDKLLRLIQYFRVARRFIERPPQIKKQAIKLDKPFLALLFAKHAAHYVHSENLTIKPTVPAMSIVRDDNPYKVKTPREG